MLQIKEMVNEHPPVSPNVKHSYTATEFNLFISHNINFSNTHTHLN